MKDKSERNIILQNQDAILRVAQEEVNNPVPAGYIEIRLSTKGKVGAPAVFHVRNFKVREIVALTLTSEEDLPVRLINTLNQMIYEDVDVANFHEREVEELMIYIYLNFFQKTFVNIPYTLDENDLKYLDDDLIKDIQDGKWKPSFDIDIEKDMSTYDIPENYNPNITITNKTTGFYVTFGYIKYGDRLTIKRWLDKVFSEDDSKFKNTKMKIIHNNDIINNHKDLANLYELSEEEEKDYEEYSLRRLETLTEVSQIISVVDYNGMDVSKMNLDEKYNLLSEDSRIDYGMISKLASRQNKNPIGIKPDITFISPITHEPVTRRFSFRIPVILQAMQLYGDSNYDDGYNE